VCPTSRQPKRSVSHSTIACVVSPAIAPHPLLDVADPTIQLDEQRKLLIRHVREPGGGRHAELSLSRRQPVGSRHVPAESVLELAVDTGHGVAEHLRDQVPMTDRMPHLEGHQQTSRRGEPPLHRLGDLAGAET